MAEFEKAGDALKELAGESGVRAKAPEPEDSGSSAIYARLTLALQRIDQLSESPSLRAEQPEVFRQLGDLRAQMVHFGMPMARLVETLDQIDQLLLNYKQAPQAKARRPSRPAGRPRGISVNDRIARVAAETQNAETLKKLYQHTVMCQCSMPYTDPGDEVRQWRHDNGDSSLIISAGEAAHPRTKEMTPFGLPFGPKPRLLLAHLNAIALKSGESVFDVESTISHFAERTLQVVATGSNLDSIREQLMRLAYSSISLTAAGSGNTILVHRASPVSGLKLEETKDSNGVRILWPVRLALSLDYLHSLQEHAVPLVEDHLHALAHSARALDVYCWLAQRLFRVQEGKPAFLPWPMVQGQFGMGYSRVRDFRSDFKDVLKQVLALYNTAKVEVSEKGITLRQSPPPVVQRMLPFS